MRGYQSVKYVTCTSLFPQQPHQQDTSGTKDEDKIYLDAHSIGSNDNSVMNEVLLSGVFHKTRPFLEKISYQIPTSQYDFKFLYKLPHDNITEIFKLKTKNAKKVKGGIPLRIVYHAKDKFYIYFSPSNESQPLDGVTDSEEELITRYATFPHKSHIIPLSNLLALNGCDDVKYFVKIFYGLSGDQREGLTRIRPTDKIINYFTNLTLHTVRDEPQFIIVFKDFVGMAKLKLMDCYEVQSDIDCGYEVDYDSLYPSSTIEAQRYKLIITEKIKTEHLKIIDALFYTQEIEIKDGVKQKNIQPILISSNGRAYFYNTTLDKIVLQIASNYNRLFKAYIWKNYCILYNDDEFIIVNMQTFKPARVNLNISPRSIFHIEDSLFILGSNSKVYKLQFNDVINPILKIDRFKFKLGLPLIILPLKAKGGRTLILSQHDYNGTKSKKDEGLCLSLFNNQSMETIKTFEIPHTVGVSYSLMEPLLKDHSHEACYWDDMAMISYKLPNSNKSHWHIVRIIRGREIRIVLEGELNHTITSIFTEPHSIGSYMKISMSTATGIKYIILSHEENRVIIEEEGESPLSAEVYNVGGFYQNGTMQVINPYNGLYLNNDVDGEMNLVEDAQYTRPQIFGDGTIMKVATKVWEPLDRLEYNVPLEKFSKEHDDPFRPPVKVYRFDEDILLSTKYNERKDFQKTFCAMLASDNFIYLYDDVSELLPNSSLATRPVLKFKPDQRIVNITPISQNYEDSSLENRPDMIPLFFLLGLNGTAYILSVSYDAAYTDENSVTISIDDNDTSHENNGAPLWIKRTHTSSVRISFKLIPF
ncbi:hypothetical protein MOUN0_O02872 [Monosporozyma unispora]